MKNRSLYINRVTPRQIVARILNEPSLVASVQSLAPRTLGRLIDRLGLEDSGELISLATTEQIKQLFDDDLWKSDRPGNDETFDAKRFALWLEIMLEGGEELAAQKLLELPEEMVTLGLHRNIFVLHIEQLQLELEDCEHGKAIEKALEGHVYEEFDEYLVVARQSDGWDSIVAILVALDKHDHTFLVRALERCCDMSLEYIDDNGGLYDVLTSDEMIESDLAAEREDRRAAEGFIAPSQAAGFLALCRSTAPEEVVAAPRDAVTRAYFRELSPAMAPNTLYSARALTMPDGLIDRTADLERMLGELEGDAFRRGGRPVFLLESWSGAAGAGPAIFKTALTALHARDPKVHTQRLEELAYLTNAVISGSTVDGRTFRPFEAVVAVAAVCNLGLEHIVRGMHDKSTIANRAADWLRRGEVDKAFRVGWWLLHHDVALATCDALACVLTARARKTTNVALRRAYERSAKFTEEKRAQGKPMLARNRLSDLDMDDRTRAVIEGLLSECPLLVGPLATAGANGYRLDRERQFVASKADLKRVRAFLAALDPGY